MIFTNSDTFKLLFYSSSEVFLRYVFDIVSFSEVKIFKISQLALASWNRNQASAVLRWNHYNG